MVVLNSMGEGDLVAMVQVARMRLGQRANYSDDMAVLNIFEGPARKEYLISLIYRLRFDLSRQKGSLNGRMRYLSLA